MQDVFICLTFVQQCEATDGKARFEAAVFCSELTVLSFGATLSLA